MRKEEPPRRGEGGASVWSSEKLELPTSFLSKMFACKPLMATTTPYFLRENDAACPPDIRDSLARIQVDAMW